MRKQDKQLVIQNTEIYNYWRSRLVSMALSQFEWHGLPDTCDPWYFEKILLFNGSAAVYKVKESDIFLSTAYVFDAKKGNAFTVYGYPTSILGMGYNAANIQTDEFEVLYDNRNHDNLTWMIDLYAKKLWETEMTFRSNLKQQNTPYIVATTKNESLSFTNFFNRIFGFEPVIQVKNTSNIDEAVKVFDLKKEYIGNELLDTLKSIWNEACHMLGITGETTKKERLLDGEIQMNRMQDTITMSSRLLNRVEFANKINKRWGWDVTVNLVAADTEFMPYVDPYFDMDGDSGGQPKSTVEKEEENDG
jgi:hypothetical protein